MHRFYCFQVLLRITDNSYLIPNPFLYIKTILFQTSQFTMSTQSSSIWPIDWTLSGATTLGQSRPGSDGNKGVLRIPLSSSVTGASLSDYFMSNVGHSLEESYPFAGMQSVYSVAATDWACQMNITEYPSSSCEKHFGIIRFEAFLACPRSSRICVCDFRWSVIKKRCTRERERGRERERERERSGFWHHGTMFI